METVEEAPTLFGLTAADLVAAYRARTLRPSEVLDAVLARVDALEPTVHAFATLEPDQARAAALDADRSWASGVARGALDGVPVTLKENLWSVGTANPAGTAALADAEPSTVDGPSACALKESGAVRLGKTVMPDYGMLSSGVSSLYGISRSPWNPDWTTGGSSAGAAVAAAARFGPVHIGTDIGGSIRLPAAWQGLASLKPTYGIVPCETPYPGRTVGPLARTVRDLALAMQVLTRPDRRDHTWVDGSGLDWAAVAGEDLSWEPAGLRVAVHTDAGWGLPTDPVVAAAVDRAAALFEAAGAHVERLERLVRPELLEALDLFLRARSYLDISSLEPARAARVLPFVVEWAAGAAAASGREVMAAYQGVLALQRETLSASAAHDLVLSPVAPVLAFPAHWPMPSNDPATSLHHIGYTAPYNFSGQPAATVNGAVAGDGRLVGVQLAGRRMGDVDVLRAARWYEQARPADARPAWPR